MDALDVTVAPKTVARAMRILNVLVRRMEEAGFPVTVSDGRTSARVCGEDIEFSLVEATSREERPPTESEKRWAKLYEHYRDRAYYDLTPTGRLVLQIHGCSWGRRARWADGKQQKLEALLNKFIVGAIEIVGARRTRREEWEAREREWRRQEELRRQKLEEAEREKARLQQLLDDCAAWHRAARLRAYLEALKTEVLRGTLTEVYGCEPEAGLRWANQQADLLNPWKFPR